MVLLFWLVVERHGVLLPTNHRENKKSSIKLVNDVEKYLKRRKTKKNKTNVTFTRIQKWSEMKIIHFQEGLR
ncbi:hypothetical protein ACT7DM_13795 [Bacillus cereus]